jgi:hypothetical protein
VKTNTTFALVIGLLLVTTTACGAGAPTATPDTEATVAAAVAATSTAQAGMQATIDAAVQATGAAAPTPASSPTPSSEEYVTLSEEELADMIDEAVTEATTATQTCTTAATEAAADDAITQEEVAEVEAHAVEAEEAIAYAEELITAYCDLYGELASETIDLLLAIEEDLATMAESTAAIAATLQEIDTALARGLALAEETIAQLEGAAQAASAKAAEIQAQNQAWLHDLQAELETRAADALAVQPDNVAADRRAAILSAFEYVDAVRDGLADSRISQSELIHIAQLGANASASLSAHGTPQLQQLSGSINDITSQVARGQMPQAKASLGSLESALGSRPPRPSRP